MDDNDLQYLYTVYLGRNNSHPMKEHHLEDRTDFIIPAGTHANILAMTCVSKGWSLQLVLYSQLRPRSKYGQG